MNGHSRASCITTLNMYFIFQPKAASSTLVFIFSCSLPKNTYIATGYESGCERHGGLVVSVLVSRLSCPGSSPGQGHYIVFLGRTLYSHCASLHPHV